MLEYDVITNDTHEQKQKNELTLNDYSKLILQDESKDEFLHEIAQNESPEVMDVDWKKTTASVTSCCIWWDYRRAM